MTVQEWKNLVKSIYEEGDCNDSIVVAVGETGIGKSEVVRQVAEEQGCGYQDVWFSQMEGPGDYLGRTERQEVEVDGIQQSVTRFAVPSFFPISGNGILSIEEVFSTPPDLVEAFKSLVSYRSLGDWVCPPGWVVVGTTNPYEGDRGHEYNTFEVDLAVRQRIITVNVVADFDEWIDWGQKNGLYEPMIQFLQNDPSRWNTTPPRSWKQLSDWSFRLASTQQISDIAISLLGTSVGSTYIQHLANSETMRPVQISDIVDTSVDVAGMIDDFIADGRLDIVTASADNISSIGPEDLDYENEEHVDRLAQVLVSLPVETFAAIWRSLFNNYKDMYKELTTREDILDKMSEAD